MPISKKIQDEIEKIDVTTEEKKLMKDIIEIEDAGVFRYQAEYEKRIKAYIDAFKKEDK